MGLEDFTGDETYLRLLREALEKAFDKFAKENAPLLPPTPPGGSLGAQQEEEVQPGRGAPHPPQKPDLIYYLAGADPYREDQLGGLALTLDGLKERDRLVIDAARRRGIPLAITFAGGYARRLDDTIAIHTNTIRTARETFAATDTRR